MSRLSTRTILAAILISVLGLQLYYAVIGSQTSHMTHLHNILRNVVSGKMGTSNTLSKSESQTLDLRDIHFRVTHKNVTTKNVRLHKSLTHLQATDMLTQNHLLTSKKETEKSNLTQQRTDVDDVAGRNIFPHKVFIYELPGIFNSDLVQCVSQNARARCFDMSHFGYGRQLYTDSGLTVRATWQFSLELIIHNKFLHCSYRTRNASEASVFYVPYYGALASFCYPRQPYLTRLVNFTAYVSNLSAFLLGQAAFRNRRPHLMTLGKIEREMHAVGYPIIPHDHWHHMVFVGIEQEKNIEHRKFYTPGLSPLIVAPYPSYGHLVGEPGTTHAYLKTLYLEPRNVFILIAASTRRSNPFRRQLLDQFAKFATHASYSEYFATRYNKHVIDSIWLQTNECTNQHENDTLTWMKHAVFCLQPPGDSPTRKSFYDAIMAGCIPVIFRGNSHIIYPFERKLDYTSFTVSINESDIPRHRVSDILAPFKTIHHEKVKAMQQNILKVLPRLQYTYPPDSNTEADAFDMILQETANRFKL